MAFQPITTFLEEIRYWSQRVAEGEPDAVAVPRVAAITRTARWRTALWLLQLVTMISIFVGLACSGQTDRSDPYFPWRLSAVTLVGFTYAFYFREIAFTQVFNKPITAVTKFGLVTYCLLSVAIFLTSAGKVAKFADEQGLARLLELVSGVSLLAVYFLWSLHCFVVEPAQPDYDSLPSHVRRGSVMWGWVDVVLGLLVSVDLTWGLDFGLSRVIADQGFQPFAAALDVPSVKDWTILASLVLYYGLRRAMRPDIDRDADYPSLHTEFTRNQTVPTWEPPLASLLGSARVSRILDIGCGGGQRLKELVDELSKGDNLAGSIDVVGIERRNGHFRKDFRAAFDGNPHVRGAEFVIGPFSTKLRDDDVRRFDLIHVSHYADDPGRVDEVVGVLRRLRPGCLVLFRGVHASSLAFTLNAHNSRRTSSPTIRHLWDSVFMEEIKRQVDLEALGVVTVAQSYVGSDSDHNLELLVDLQYGSHVGRQARAILDALRFSKQRELPNWNRVLLFRTASQHDRVHLAGS